jgi:8-amino-7-oxononanoate synthase
MKRYAEKLADLEKRNRLRALKLPQGIDLTSNDYLGLRSHPDLKKAAVAALEAGIGLGAGGSRLLRGHSTQHADLEAYAAAFFASEKALYFSTGYQANFALFTTLPGRHDVILYDSLLHASARDGISASPARSLKILHNDLDAFEDALERTRKEADQVWIAVESLYSMDGDRAPLESLYALAQRYGAILIVDEAHATGVLGVEGRGLAYELPYQGRIILHGCGKALGGAGALMCADSVMIDYMINAARPFIFSTAPPPLQALLAHEALKISASAEGQNRRTRLADLCAFSKKLFSGHGTHIIPIVLGTDDKALAAAKSLQEAGYDIRAIRPPSVPEGTSRLRLSLNADLNKEILQDVAAHLVPYRERRAA